MEFVSEVNAPAAVNVDTTEVAIGNSVLCTHPAAVHITSANNSVPSVPVPVAYVE